MQDPYRVPPSCRYRLKKCCLQHRGDGGPGGRRAWPRSERRDALGRTKRAVYLTRKDSRNGETKRADSVGMPAAKTHNPNLNPNLTRHRLIAIAVLLRHGPSAFSPIAHNEQRAPSLPRRGRCPIPECWRSCASMVENAPRALRCSTSCNTEWAGFRVASNAVSLRPSFRK
jgi:hypothetical protein